MLVKSPRGWGFFFGFQVRLAQKKSPTLDFFFKFIEKTEGYFKLSLRGGAFFPFSN